MHVDECVGGTAFFSPSLSVSFWCIFRRVFRSSLRRRVLEVLSKYFEPVDKPSRTNRICIKLFSSA